jgi:hypothetical protein
LILFDYFLSDSLNAFASDFLPQEQDFSFAIISLNMLVVSFHRHISQGWVRDLPEASVAAAWIHLLCRQVPVCFFDVSL